MVLIKNKLNGGGDMKGPSRAERFKAHISKITSNTGSFINRTKKSYKQWTPGANIKAWWQKPGITKKAGTSMLKIGTAITSLPKLTRAAYNRRQSIKAIKAKVGVHVNSMEQKFKKLQSKVQEIENAKSKQKSKHEIELAKLLKKHQGKNIRNVESNYQKELKKLQKKHETEKEKLEKQKTKKQQVLNDYLIRKHQKIRNAKQRQGLKITEKDMEKDILFTVNRTANKKFESLRNSAKNIQTQVNSNLQKKIEAKKQELDQTYEDRKQKFKNFQNSRDELIAKTKEIANLKNKLKTFNYQGKTEDYNRDYNDLQNRLNQIPNLKENIKKSQGELANAQNKYKQTRDEHRKLSNEFSKETVAGRESRIKRANNTFSTFKKGFEQSTPVRQAYSNSVKGYGEALGMGKDNKASRFRGTVFTGKKSEEIGRLIDSVPKVKKNSVERAKRAQASLNVLRAETERRLNKTQFTTEFFDEISKDTNLKNQIFNLDNDGKIKLNSRGNKVPLENALEKLENTYKTLMFQYKIATPEEKIKMHSTFDKLNKLKSYLNNYQNLLKINAAYDKLYQKN